MENNLHAVVLAIIQGLTEFLPVSSSAHLILAPAILHWPDQGLAFDVIIHLGTLFAVLMYFRKELTAMCADCWQACAHKHYTKNFYLACSIAIATIPVGIAGVLGNHIIATYFRSPIVIAITTILFGILLGIATVVAKQKRNEYSLTWRDAIFIGAAQAIALIPGTSRSGITLTAGLFAGLTRAAAARFSFLMSIPVIILAASIQCVTLYKQPEPIDFQALGIGLIVAAISGYLCIDVFLKLLDRYGLMPFVIYRLILGCILLAVFA